VDREVPIAAIVKGEQELAWIDPKLASGPFVGEGYRARRAVAI
jgi:hypothetical protein